MPHGPHPSDGRDTEHDCGAPVDVAVAVLPQAAHKCRRSDDEEGVRCGDFLVHPEEVGQYGHRKDGSASAD